MGRAWLVRADEGTGIDRFEQEGFVGIRGGRAEPQSVDTDLTDADPEEISRLVAEVGLPGAYVTMLRHIARTMEVGDLVVTPGPRDEPGQPVAVGTIASDYYFRPSEPLRHRREVRWQGRVSREALPARFWAGKLAAVSEIDPADVPDPG